MVALSVAGGSYEGDGDEGDVSVTERFSILALEGSRNVSSLSQRVKSLRSSPLSRNDHDVDAFIASVRNALPASRARINRLRCVIYDFSFISHIVKCLEIVLFALINRCCHWSCSKYFHR